jgi:hypothetical protein
MRWENGRRKVAEYPESLQQGGRGGGGGQRAASATKKGAE